MYCLTLSDRTYSRRDQSPVLSYSIWPYVFQERSVYVPTRTNMKKWIFLNNIILIVNRKNKCQNKKFAKIESCRLLGSRQDSYRLFKSRLPTWHLMWRTRPSRKRPIGAKRPCRPLDSRQALVGPIGCRPNKGFGPTDIYRPPKGRQDLIGSPRADRSLSALQRPTGPCQPLGGWQVPVLPTGPTSVDFAYIYTSI